MQPTQATTTTAIAALDWDAKGITCYQKKLGDFVQTLQQDCEVNNIGMPLTYVDPTVIAETTHWCASPDDIPDDKFNASIVPIEFEDGLPTVNGLPFWERLDGETLPYYNVFKQYRDMKYYNNTHLNTRSIARLGEEIGVPGRFLSILGRIYHWSPRCKAFDMYRERELQLRRQRDMEQLENKHSKYAMDLLEQAIAYLKDNPKQLNPKTALDMVELGMKYGRVSAGLLGDKPGQTAASSVHQTNIAIQSNSNTQMDHSQNGVVLNNGTGSNSPAGRKLADNLKDNGTLASILHVLNRSGALSTAAPETPIETTMDETPIVDVIDITPIETNSKEGENV